MIEKPDWIGKARLDNAPICDDSISWVYYLARPFTLFEASIQHQWYISPAFREISGTEWKKGLFVEYPKGVARQYREKEKLQHFSQVMEKLVSNPEKLKSFFDEGIYLNAKAEELLKKNTFTSLQSAV